MKHGDLVSTPSGTGVFFNLLDQDKTKAYVRLRDPVEEGKIWVPLVEDQPMWETFPCNVFNLADMKVEKTVEERQREAQLRALQAQAQRDETLRQKMAEFQEQQRQTHEQQANQG